MGLIDYDLRRKLHPKRKEKIERLAREYNEVLNRPQQFISRNIGKETGKNLEKSGYKTFKTTGGQLRSLIPIPSDATKVVIKKGRVTVSYDGFTEKWLIGKGPSEFQREMIRLKKQQEKNPRNFQITGKVGSNQPFKHSRFTNVDDLLKYLQAWKLNYPKDITAPRERDDYKDNLIQHLSIVEIDTDFRKGK